MEKVLRFFEKYLIPKPLYRLGQPIYHFTLAFFAALIYGFPSRKMTIIGVTGTKGKTTTCNLIAQILNYAGLKTGMATTVNFRIGKKEWPNETKQTMLGRFHLQKLIARMAKEKCKYAVIETSSEGILQYRHQFIDYDMAVFTNLSPEHIERHGGFENYRAAKIKLFEKVAKKENGVGVYNLDDENARYFLEPKIANQYVYTQRFAPPTGGKIQNLYHISYIKTSAKGTNFFLNKEQFKMPLIGEFNAYNAVAAISAVRALNVPMGTIKKALLKVQPPPGRLEMVDKGQKFTAIIDYSYEPASLENALKTMKIFKPRRTIALFGSAGGGRDKWRRPVMGEIADKYADLIIITTDDPYDESPLNIIKDILKGVLKNRKRILDKNVFAIADRKTAIKKAIGLAKKNDAILFAGKGGETWMNVANGKKIPWNETEIVKELIGELVN